MLEERHHNLYNESSVFVIFHFSKDYCHREFTRAKQEETIKTLIPNNCLALPTDNCVSMEDEIRRVRGLRGKGGGEGEKGGRGEVGKRKGKEDDASE